MNMWHLSPKFFLLVAFVAEASAQLVDKWGPLLNTGAMGCMLLWFMLQFTPQIKSLVAAMDRSTRMMGLALIGLDYLPRPVKDQAGRILSEIENKNAVS